MRLNKRSLSSLVYRPLANRSQRNSIFSQSIPGPPILIDFSKSVSICSRNSTQKKTDAKSIYFRRKKKGGLSTVERSLDLELDLISYFWNFVSNPLSSTMRNNARDEERGKRQVRSLECLQIAKKIGRLLSLDARLGIAALIVPPLFEWRKEEGVEKKKYPRDSSGWLLDKIRGDSIEKSGRDENHYL